MRTLVLPDIHNQVEKAERIIASEKNDQVVLTGDYFDDFGDSPTVARKTAEWLVKSLSIPNRVHLIGNHDISYLFAPADKWSRPKKGNEWMLCSGFSKQKFKTIRNVLKGVDLFRLSLSYRIGDWFFSHAGLRYNLFAHPVLGFDRVASDCQTAIEKAKMGIYTAILGCGRARGGREEFGGIIWQDWTEFEPIEGINQVLGHSFGTVPRFKTLGTSENCCLDTGLNHYAILEDGRLEVLRFVD